MKEWILCSSEGYGTKRNFNKAMRYFQLASHGGRLYPLKSYSIYKIKSLIAGHLLAIYSLAEMHAEGQAVKRNCNYAVEVGRPNSPVVQALDSTLI